MNGEGWKFDGKMKTGLTEGIQAAEVGWRRVFVRIAAFYSCYLQRLSDYNEGLMRCFIGLCVMDNVVFDTISWKFEQPGG